MLKTHELKAVIRFSDIDVHYLFCIDIANNVNCEVIISPIITWSMRTAHMYLDSIIFFFVKYVVIN